MGRLADHQKMMEPIVECMKGQVIETITFPQLGNMEIKFENGPIMYIYAHDFGDGELEIDVIETKGTDRKWIKKFYNWKPKRP